MGATYEDVIDTVIVNLQLAAQQGGTYTPPPDYATIIPRMIEYAENRIYRKMVFLGTRAVNSALTATNGSRTIDLSTLVAASPALLVLEGVALITPQGDAPSAGTRWQFDPMSLDTIDFTWPQESKTLAPNNTEERGWALKDYKTLVIKPTPDAAYTAELTGIWAPAPLSPTNVTTYLTTYYDDLMVAACMIWAAGHQRDFGLAGTTGGAEDQLAMSWEKVYSRLETEAMDEENRRRGLSPFDGATSRASTPPR